MSKADDYNLSLWLSNDISASMFTELVRNFQEHNGLEVDGLCGPVTQAALKVAMAVDLPVDKSWKAFDGPLDRQPRNRKEVYEIFGNPGTHAEDKSWTQANIISCHQSRGNRLPGVPAERWVEIHKDVEPYLREALRRAQVVCPDHPIERIGGHYWRPIRKKAGNPLSMHSWGIAVDINPHWNFTRSYESRGTGPRAWTPEYFKVWPKGVPKAFVEAFTSCGFAWGSDWDEDGLVHDHTFYDPMHFEFVARDGKAHLV